MRQLVLAGISVTLGCNDPRLLAVGGDAAPDAAETITTDAANAEPGIVSISVTRSGAPGVGVVVYFQNGDSSVVASATTDWSGTASATMMAGGYVTAVLVGETSTGLYTFAGVKPGDHLTVNDFVETAINVFSSAPTDPATPFGYYNVFSTNTSVWYPVDANTPTSLSQFRAGLGDFMVVTTSDWETAPIDYLYQPDVLLGNGSLIELYGTYQPTESATFSYANLSSNESVALRSYVVTPRGVAYASMQNSWASAANPMVAAQVPAPPGTTALTFSGIDETTSIQGASHYVIDWGPANPTYALDVATTNTHHYTSTPVFDPVHHAITWTESGTIPDMVDTGYSVWRNHSAVTFGWGIVAPRTNLAAVHFPTLPVTDGVDYNPQPGDATSIGEVSNITTPGGYDAIRPWGFSSTDFAELPTIPSYLGLASGRAVISTFEFQ